MFLKEGVTLLSAIVEIPEAAAIITGGVVLYLTVSKSKTHEVQARLRPTSLVIAGAF